MELLTFGCDVNTEGIKEWLTAYEYFETPVTITYVAAEYKKDFFEKAHEGETFPGNNSFRAFNMIKEGVIYIFVDDCETPDSLLWLTFHELTHTALYRERILIQYFCHKRNDFIKEKFGFQDAWEAQDFYLKDESIVLEDDIHENLPEEKLCNDLATRLVGTDYSRPWWRARQKEVAGWT